MPAATTAASQADDIRAAIAAALRAMLRAPVAEGAAALFNALGYVSDRVSPMPGDDPQTFVDARSAPNPGAKSEREFLDAARKFKLLFQVANDEIAAQSQPSLMGGAPAYDEGNASSFIFAAAQLKPRPNGLPYSRSHYARFIREINKGIPPVVALFRTEGENEISIAFILRRPSKTQANRDVLEKVSVIRGVSLTNPHRAHADILAELHLQERQAWMTRHGKPQNFDGLLAAWLDALDTDALTDKFYKDLFRWFQSAVRDAKFPADEARTLSREEHIIRLITRILFVWFIKEKGLVSADLFVENKVERLLKDYDAAKGDSYYRAVLQNLFFATLNTESGRRGFSDESPKTHRDFSRRRYKAQIADPKTLTELFDETPFINGGLFDCLDSEPATSDGGYRIDCFSDNAAHYSKLSIPNRLFFDGEDGLISLFERYKFTVEENTPLEQEVALDPELLGNVFENLLAAYNPETRDTARRRTGSYYTPRAVVDYMVDESLIAALSEKIAPAQDARERLRNDLRRLLDYASDDEDAASRFSDDERQAIVTAVAKLKIIDPAVGSGAFPMGILHKLTLVLRRVDPDNSRWERLQREIAGDRARGAFETGDKAERDAELDEISRIFERYRDSDFGRKLYLIQNSIYGVDKQPVAVQIAKLRFFISLAIEQTPDRDAKDHGIRPLPNLETRFIAADTLIGLRGLQGMLTSPEVAALQDDLRRNRENHFHARTRPEKLRCSREDKRLRGELQAALQKYDFPADDAAKIADWDAFDQNAPAAEWFDAEYMFGVKDGFDVAIGNPPYIQLQKNDGEMRLKYKDAGYSTLVSTGDIYQLFYEKGASLLTPGAGLLAYITSNSWLKAEYGKNTRRMFAESHAPLQLIEMGKDVFQNAIVDSAILLARSGKSDEIAKAVDMDKLADKSFPPAANLWGELRASGEREWNAMSTIERGIMDKMEAVGTPLSDWGDLSINMGVKTGLNDAFIIDGATKDALIAADPKSAEIIKPILRGRDIRRYAAEWAGRYLIDTHNGYGDVPAVDIDDYPAVKAHLDGFSPRLEKRYDKGKTPYNLRHCAYHQDFAKEKLIWMDLTPEGRFAYDNDGTFCQNSAYILTGDSIKYLCAVLNSSLITWYFEKIARTSGMGTLCWEKAYVERIPVPPASASKRAELAGLVERILSAKASVGRASASGLAGRASASGLAGRADTSGLERRVDELVLELYGLSAGEEAAIAGSLAP